MSTGSSISALTSPRSRVCSIREADLDSNHFGCWLEQCRPCAEHHRGSHRRISRDLCAPIQTLGHLKDNKHRAQAYYLCHWHGRLNIVSVNLSSTGVCLCRQSGQCRHPGTGAHRSEQYLCFTADLPYLKWSIDRNLVGDAPDMIYFILPKCEFSAQRRNIALLSLSKSTPTPSSLTSTLVTTRITLCKGRRTPRDPVNGSERFDSSHRARLTRVIFTPRYDYGLSQEHSLTFIVVQDSTGTSVESPGHRIATPPTLRSRTESQRVRELTLSMAAAQFSDS
jgi:hypothetical protein